MKKKVTICLLILLATVLLVSCAERDRNQPFDPMTSSIFETAEVRNVRLLESMAVKAGAGQNHQTLQNLPAGEIVRVLGRLDDWYVIRFDNFKVGVIESRNTEPVVQDRRRIPTRKEIQGPVEERADIEEPAIDPTPEVDPEPELEPEQEVEDRPLADRAEQGLDQQERNQERQLIEMINQERRKYDLPDLIEDPDLSRVARVKAQDMVDNKYFSHNSPTYGSPFDMMSEYNIDYQYAGENLALNNSVERAHQALMNSSGHRRNILSPDFTHLGVGVRPSEQGFIYVEMFIGVPQ